MIAEILARLASTQEEIETTFAFRFAPLPFHFSPLPHGRRTRHALGHQQADDHAKRQH